MRPPVIGLLLALALSAPTPVRASVILYDNFGGGNAYTAGAGHTVSTAASGAGFAQTAAMPFTPGVGATLESLTLALGRSGGANDVYVELRADAAGVPGAALETFHVVNALGGFGLGDPPVSLTSAGHPLMQAGNTYWVVARAGGADTWAAWNFNSAGDSGPLALSNDNLTYYPMDDTRGAFRVVGVQADAVPEPGTAAVLGVLAACGLAARRRAGRRVTPGRT